MSSLKGSTPSADISYLVLKNVTSKQKEEVFYVLNNAYYSNSNTSLALDIAKNPRAVDEINGLCGIYLDDNISVAAIDNQTKKIVGVVLNKIQTKPTPGVKSLLEEYMENECKEKESLAFMKLMIVCNRMVNLFEILNVNKLVRLAFLSVLPEYRNNRIAYNLSKISIDLIDELGAQADGPKATTAQFSSKYSRRIGEILNFKLYVWLSYECFSYENVKYSEKVNKEHLSNGIHVTARKYVSKT